MGFNGGKVWRRWKWLGHRKSLCSKPFSSSLKVKSWWRMEGELRWTNLDEKLGFERDWWWNYMVMVYEFVRKEEEGDGD